MFIHEGIFKELTGDQFDNIQFSLTGLQLTNQSEMNHDIIKLENYDLWQRPQFTISIFETLDSLEVIFDKVCQHTFSPSP